MTDALRPARPVPPGHILRREMEARGWAVEDVIERDNWLDYPQFHALLQGTGYVSMMLAEHLAGVFQTSSRFWLNLQRQYDEAVAASKEEK